MNCHWRRSSTVSFLLRIFLIFIGKHIFSTKLSQQIVSRAFDDTYVEDEATEKGEGWIMVRRRAAESSLASWKYQTSRLWGLRRRKRRNVRRLICFCGFKHSPRIPTSILMILYRATNIIIAMNYTLRRWYSHSYLSPRRDFTITNFWRWRAVAWRTSCPPSLPS